MDAVNMNSAGNSVNMQAGIYAEKKSQEVEENQVHSALKMLDDKNQQQIQVENAQITGIGGNLNIKG